MNIIFDWDGTLFQTAPIYGKAFRKVYQNLVKEGLAKERYFSDEEMSKYLGMNSIDMWNSFMPELAETKKNESSALVGSEMISLIDNDEAKLFDNTKETLDKLVEDGNTLIFLSNCKHKYLEANREKFKLDKWFSDYYCCEDYNFIPKEEIFLSFKDKFKGLFIVVGDRGSDIKVASDNNLLSIGCIYGYGNSDELSEATYLIENIREIPEIIKELNKIH